MIISFSGAAGSGKTTVGKEISRQFGINFRPELVDEVFDKHRIRPMETISTVTKEILRVYKQAQESLLAKMIEADNNVHSLDISVICDRSVVDVMAYYLFWCSGIASKEDFKSVEKVAKDHAKIYTSHVVFPVSDIIIDESFRSSNVVYQRAIYTMVLGILDDWQLDHVILKKSDVRSVSREVAAIIKDNT